MSINDITGDRLATRVSVGNKYQSNYDKIFNKEKVEDPDVTLSIKLEEDSDCENK